MTAVPTNRPDLKQAIEAAAERLRLREPVVPVVEVEHRNKEVQPNEPN